MSKRFAYHIDRSYRRSTGISAYVMVSILLTLYSWINEVHWYFQCARRVLLVLPY
jgi:hypothetical protein